MNAVYVKIKDEKQAEKVIKNLVRIGYSRAFLNGTENLAQVKIIYVSKRGIYQLLQCPDAWGARIKPKDLLNSEPVKYFMEHKHV